MNRITSFLSPILACMALIWIGSGAWAQAESAAEPLDEGFSVYEIASATTSEPTAVRNDPLPLRWAAPEDVDAGDPAPLFQLMELDGRHLVYLSGYRGKRLALYVTAAWIPQATPLAELARFQRQNGENGHQVLGVSVDHDPTTRLLPVLNAHDAEAIPFVVDPMLTLAQDYGIRQLPALFLIDEHGQVVLRREPLEPEEFPEVLARMREWTEMPLEDDEGTGEGRLAPRQRWRALQFKVTRHQKDAQLREEMAIAFYDAGLYHRALNQFKVADALHLHRPSQLLRWRMGVVHDALNDRREALAFWRAAGTSLHEIDFVQTLLRVAEDPRLYERLRSAPDRSFSELSEGS